MGYFHKDGLDYCLSGLADLYLGLANSDDARGADNALEYTKENTSQIEEPSGGGYSRIAITFSTIEDATNGRKIKNTTQLQFSFNDVVTSGVSDGGQSGQVTHWFVCDAASGTANIISSGKLDNAPITPNNGVLITFPANSIELGLTTVI